MPVVDFEFSPDRTRFQFDRHVGRRIMQDCDSGFIGLAGRAK
ncbi:hypothetical protein [Burkholderia contaminans]|jgi:hypothetical protein|nr:hypothetical protein [Burkholderia contaminans]VWD22160.1 hypothetical protein BCO37747_04018 [Burkholderia contaminans]